MTLETNHMNPHPCGGGFLKDPILSGGLLGPLSVRVTTKGGIRYSPFSI